MAPVTSSARARLARRRCRVGDLLRDHALMERARAEASAWLDAGGSGDGGVWLDEFRRTWGERYGLVRVG